MPRSKDTSREIVDLFAELEQQPVADEPADDVPVAPTPDPEPATEPEVPAPAEPAESTAAQRVAALERELAQARAGFYIPSQERDDVTANAEDIVIHFVENGFTALGSIWYRGQEIEFPAGSQAYKDTCDRFGKSWLDLRDDEDAQIDKYGVVMFRNGPWRGKTYVDGANGHLDIQLKPLREGDKPILPPTQDELHAAAQTEQRRNRRAPRVEV